MTIAYVNAGTFAHGNGEASHEFALPASIVAGNILLAVVKTQHSGSPSWSAGWTPIATVGTTYKAAIAYRVATGSDTAPTVTFGGTTSYAGQVLHYSGSGGVGATSSNFNDSGTTNVHSTTGFTSTGNNSAAVYLDASVNSTTLADPSGWTDHQSNSGVNGSVDAGIKLLGSSGSASGAISEIGSYGWSQFQVELLAPPEPSSGSSDIALPVVTGSGNAYSGIESDASLPSVTASGTAIRSEAVSADSAAQLSGTPVVVADFMASIDGAITASDSAAVMTQSYPTIAEAIAAASAGSAPTIFFETISESASAATGASAYSLFILVVNSSASANGAGAASAIYALSAESIAALMTGTQFVADFTDGWAYNLNTGAASFYEGMAFNSFALIDGEYYGCNAAGIYRLTGDDDAGADIQATITLGTSRLDSDAIKTVPFAYVGAQSAEPMLLTCRVEGQEYRYEFSRETAVMAPAKVKPGKGLEGTYWQVEISNQNGANLDLDSLELITAPKSRKV